MMYEYGVYQRKHNDCGVAAIATLAKMSYEDVELAWRNSLGRGPGSSRYSDIIKVLGFLGIPARKVVSTDDGIRRARYKAGDSHSHWIVMLGGAGVWCPWDGFHLSIDDYAMRILGHGVEI